MRVLRKKVEIPQIHEHAAHALTYRLMMLAWMSPTEEFDEELQGDVFTLKQFAVFSAAASVFWGYPDAVSAIRAGMEWLREKYMGAPADPSDLQSCDDVWATLLSRIAAESPQMYERFLESKRLASPDTCDLKTSEPYFEALEHGPKGVAQVFQQLTGCDLMTGLKAGKVFAALHREARDMCIRAA